MQADEHTTRDWCDAVIAHKSPAPLILDPDLEEEVTLLPAPARSPNVRMHMLAAVHRLRSGVQTVTKTSFIWGEQHPTYNLRGEQLERCFHHLVIVMSLCSDDGYGWVHIVLVHAPR